jgi:hypothetical protein
MRAIMPHSDEMELVSITVNGGGLAAVGVEEIQPNEISVIEQLVIINNGSAARPQPVIFSVALAPWVINHNLGYVPQVMVTDLAGNVFDLICFQYCIKKNQQSRADCWFHSTEKSKN